MDNLVLHTYSIDCTVITGSIKLFTCSGWSHMVGDYSQQRDRLVLLVVIDSLGLTCLGSKVRIWGSRENSFARH